MSIKTQEKNEKVGKVTIKSSTSHNQFFEMEGRIGVFSSLFLFFVVFLIGIMSTIILRQSGTFLTNDNHFDALLRSFTNTRRRRVLQEEELIHLPPSVETNLAEIWHPYDKSSETPIFWHILKSGGTSVQSYSSDCLNLVLSNEQGIQFGHDQDTVLEIMQVPSERRFINVDTSTREGIARAQQLGLAESHLADIIVSPLFPEIIDILSPEHRGRMFAILRHPIERATSMFYYLQIADWEPTYEDKFKTWTIEQYAQSEYAESNWIVRNMLQKRSGPLTEDDVNVAAEIMRRKMIIGFTDRLAESIRRFELYFGWNAVDLYRNGKFKPASECIEKYLGKEGGSNSNKHPPVVEGTEAHELLTKLNWADIMLYERALQIFEQQSSIFSSTQEA